MNPPLLPPPLPIRPPVRQRAFSHRAALASWLLPLTTCLILPSLDRATHGSGASALVESLARLVTAPLAAVGLTLGFVALGGISRHGCKGILKPSITGIVLCSLILALYAAGFTRAREGSIRARNALQDASIEARSLRAKLKTALESEEGITNVAAQVFSRLPEQFAEASRNLSGDQRVLMKTLADHLDRMRTALRNAEAMAGVLQRAEVLDLGSLIERSQIERRRDVVRAYLSSNQAVTDVLNNAETHFRSALASTSMARTRLDDTVVQLRSTVLRFSPLALAARRSEQRAGESMLGILALLETHWGRWEYRAAANEVNFEDPKAAEIYQGFIDTINAEAERQLELQRQLVNAL